MYEYLTLTDADGSHSDPHRSRTGTMMRLTCIAAAALLPFTCTSLLAAQRAARPNIVLIMADDLGYGDIGCFGSSTIHTPNIDALTRDGLKLTDYHSNGAVCSPTRAALMTGRYQQRSGISGVVTAARHRHTGLDLKETTFAEVLNEAGYATAIFGKWHLGYAPEFNPVHQGFQVFRGYVSGNVDYRSHIDQAGYFDWWRGDQLKDDTGYSTDLIARYGVDFIRSRKEHPFCLYLAFEPPHYPLQGRNDPIQRKLVDGKLVKSPAPKDGSRAYREMIEAMDEGIGKVMATLDQLNLTDNTLVFFCSDNGPATHGTAGPLHGHKGQVWEGGHRVPAVARWPSEIAAGSHSDQTVMAFDLFPTMAAATGTRLPKSLALDGVNLLPLWTTGQALEPRMLFWQHGNQRAARDGQWKMVVLKKNRPQLFHLGRDLGETKDLSKDEPERTRQMAEALELWYQTVTRGVEQRT